MTRYASALLALLLCLAAGPASGQGPHVQHLHVDNVHVRTWNRFARELYALHQQRIAGQRLRTEERVGGYPDMPKFYREVSYYDAATGRLLSRIQWEREHPDTIHVIEVFIRDARGRIIRDYTAAFLPYYRNAPTQTLISLHRYNGPLHAFRTFDASGARIFERCQGTWRGEVVDFMFDEDDIDVQEGTPGSLMESATYKACFDGLQKTAGEYLRPH